MANAFKKENIRVILFDADKTLYDIANDTAYTKIYSFLSKELGVAPSVLQKEHKEEIQKIKESLDPVKREYKYTLEKLVRKHTKDPAALADKAYRLFWDSIIEELQEKKRAKELLQQLSKNYILAIATDEFYLIVERKLNKIFGNWKDYFHTIISSDKVNTMKPSSTYYQEAMKIFNTLPGQMVMIGDSWRRDLEPAKELGIFTILVNDKEEGSPDLFVTELSQLSTLF